MPSLLIVFINCTKRNKLQTIDNNILTVYDLSVEKANKSLNFSLNVLNVYNLYIYILILNEFENIFFELKT